MFTTILSYSTQLHRRIASYPHSYIYLYHASSTAHHFHTVTFILFIPQQRSYNHIVLLSITVLCPYRQLDIQSYTVIHCHIAMPYPTLMQPSIHKQQYDAITIIPCSYLAVRQIDKSNTIYQVSSPSSHITNQSYFIMLQPHRQTAIHSCSCADLKPYSHIHPGSPTPKPYRSIPSSATQGHSGIAMQAYDIHRCSTQTVMASLYDDLFLFQDNVKISASAPFAELRFTVRYHSTSSQRRTFILLVAFNVHEGLVPRRAVFTAQGYFWHFEFPGISRNDESC